MAPHPLPRDLVVGGEGSQLLPEILILESFRSLQPAGADPARQPFAHPPDQVLGVAVDAHAPPVSQGLQPPYRRDEFHPLRGRNWLESAEFLLMLPVAQDHPIPAGPRISA